MRGAERETDPKKQIRLREAAKILAREADKLEQREEARLPIGAFGGEYRSRLKSWLAAYWVSMR